VGLVSRNLLITLALSLVAVGAGAWLGAKIFSHQHHPASLHEFVHEQLDLTVDQKARLDRLERDFAARRAAHEAELRAANAELAAAIQADHEYNPQVQAAIDRFHRAMEALQRDTVLHVLEMRTVLTPSQAVQYDQRITQALTEDNR